MEIKSVTRRSLDINPALFSSNEGHPTASSHDQQKCELDCSFLLYSKPKKIIVGGARNTVSKGDGGEGSDVVGGVSSEAPTEDEQPEKEDLFQQLKRRETVGYLLKTLVSPLSTGYISLESSRPWLLYWSLNSLKLLGFDVDYRFYQEVGLDLTEEEVEDKKKLVHSCLETCKECFDAYYGGFTGGIGQYSHTAPTYAAVLALITVGTEEAFAFLLSKRHVLYQFLYTVCKDRTMSSRGGFSVSKDGEMDTRALYTSLCIADLLGILTDELCEGSLQFIKDCQTYEGGFGGEAFNEAHGGNAYCAIASLVILLENKKLASSKSRDYGVDLSRLREWISQRQMRLEGGFQGRTNKLVDSCYSFWQGAIPALVDLLMAYDTGVEPGKGLANKKRVTWLDAEPLARYVLLCCQDEHGGMKDKPGKRRDQYHTCYSVSGLSLAQHRYDTSFELGQGKGKGVLEIDLIYPVEVNKLRKYRAFMQDKERLTHEELMIQ